MGRNGVQCGKGVVEYAGHGPGVWNYLHLLDLGELYEFVLLHWVKGKRSAWIGEMGTIFSGTGRVTWKEVVGRFAKAGFELERLKAADTREA